MSFTDTDLPNAIGNALLRVSINQYVILLLLNLLLLIAGVFMDITSAVLIFTPIFLPVATGFGMAPIHPVIIPKFPLLFPYISSHSTELSVRFIRLISNAKPESTIQQKIINTKCKNQGGTTL